MPVPLLVLLGAFAVFVAMEFFSQSSPYRPPGHHPLEEWTAVCCAILAIVLLVYGGYKWGHNSAKEDAQRAEMSAERK